jgi:hypothetical protein
MDGKDPLAPDTWLQLNFLGDTADLLCGKSGNTIRYPLTRRASIKDILESLGLPHTEVGALTEATRGRELNFTYLPQAGDNLTVHPCTPARPPTQASLLRPNPLPNLTFLVDINVWRLAAFLRLAGFDTRTVPAGPEAATVRQAIDENRILITRSRSLLRHKELQFGRLVRNQQPQEQFRELCDLYRLGAAMQPFTRCLACNGQLYEVEKAAVLDRLLPLTKKYYDQFVLCQGCGKTYWQGSHCAALHGYLRLCRKK